MAMVSSVDRKQEEGRDPPPAQLASLVCAALLLLLRSWRQSSDRLSDDFHAPARRAVRGLRPPVDLEALGPGVPATARPAEELRRQCADAHLAVLMRVPVHLQVWLVAAVDAQDDLVEVAVVVDVLLPGQAALRAAARALHRLGKHPALAIARRDFADHQVNLLHYRWRQRYADDLDAIGDRACRHAGEDGEEGGRSQD
jgi:hypothetical protein